MKIVLTGGGTGGHVYPAINIGLYMKEHFDAELSFIGNKAHIEEKIVKQYGIPFYGVTSQGFEGRNALEKYIGFGYKNSIGVIEARNILKKINPDYVIGTGGFGSAPALAACITLGIPYVIHEQNTVMGKVNKLFENRASHVFHTFPIMETRTKTCSGIPVRFKERLDKIGEKLVFTGGSGGSIKLNKFALSFANENPDIPCVVVTGEKNYQNLIIQGVPDNLTVYAYAHDMEKLYSESKIMVARSGAGSIFELANLGVPSILVPLPNSADNHQMKNAELFAKHSAAVLVEQDDNFEKNLKKEITDLWHDEGKRNILRNNMEKLSSREAEKIIAEKLGIRREAQ